jgi:hypothetical protein
MKTDFHDGSPLHGLRLGQFARLDEADIRNLRRLISRCCEKSFRRGFQQGWESRERCDELAVDLHSWRFESDLDQSFSPHGTYSSTAAERCEMECSLHSVGLVNKSKEPSDAT